MFKNLFKKFQKEDKNTSNVQVIEPIYQAVVSDIDKTHQLMKQSNNKYPAEVLEIHNEFETAADKLVVEANNIISSLNTQEIDKVNKLVKLGFTGTKQVSITQPLVKKAELSKEQIELVKEYSRKYPLNKFITEEQVEIICKKYSLICGDVSKFTGFVPDKNLNEIERFQLKGNDGKEVIWEYGSVAHSLENWKRAHSPGFVRDVITNGKQILGNVKSLQICAPIKDMNTRGMEITNGYKLEVKYVPDPVVLQPVKGGYLIVTKWGDEASDPMLINPIEN